MRLIALAAALSLTAAPVGAETLHPFVADDWAIGAGAAPAPIAAVAAAPLDYLRSVAAHEALVAWLGDRLGQAPVAPPLFSDLLTRSAILIPCAGVIRTAGITDDGQVLWHTRPCHPGERLIRIAVGTLPPVLLSQGCYNPVAEFRPAAPTIPPPRAEPLPPWLTPPPERQALATPVSEPPVVALVAPALLAVAAWKRRGRR